MRLPFPRPPGTPDLDKLEKMIRPTGGDSDPSKGPITPGGPKTPQRYSLSDHLYIAIIRSARTTGNEFPSRDIQAKIQAGHLEGVSQQHLDAWRLRNVTRATKIMAAWNEDVNRYGEGEPLLRGVPKTIALRYGAIQAATHGAFAYIAYRAARFTKNKFFKRKSATKIEGAMRMAGKGEQSSIGGAKEVTPESISAPNASEFYQRPASDAGARVEHLIQRELYLRELFRHKQ